MGRRIGSVSKSKRRHLEWPLFASRLEDGPPSVEPVRGTPPTMFFIDPGGARIGLRIRGPFRAAVPRDLEQVLVQVVSDGSEEAVELSTTNRALYRDFYLMGCAIADRVQIDKQSVADAITATVSSWTALLKGATLISPEAQIGLVGELVFLHLLKHYFSWDVVCRAWQGPAKEEHDFVLPSVDIEVKTTTGETRLHRISSLTQLQPKDQRQLALLSVQLTLSASARDAVTLAGLVASTLASCGAKNARLFRAQLEHAGWRDEDKSHYQTAYRKRSPLLLVPISREFPALTGDVLRSLSQAHASRIETVTYALNVEGLGSQEGTRSFDRIIKRGTAT